MRQMLRQTGLLLVSIIFSNNVLADQFESGLLRSSQGVSSPVSLGNLSLTNGLGANNPSGIAILQNARATGFLGLGKEGTATGRSVLGGEVGWSNGTYGMALAYRKEKCRRCSEDVTGGLAYQTDLFGLGVQLDESDYAIGGVINQKGIHKIGFVLSRAHKVSKNFSNSIFGFGYTFALENFRFSCDLSRDVSVVQGKTMLSPGIGVSYVDISAQVSYNKFLGNDTSTSYRSADFIEYGLAYQALPVWHLAVYHQSVHSWTVAFTFFL